MHVCNAHTNMNNDLGSGVKHQNDKEREHKVKKLVIVMERSSRGNPVILPVLFASAIAHPTNVREC